MRKPKNLSIAKVPATNNLDLSVSARRPKIPYLRWWIVVVIFLAAVLNYVDRQVLSVLAPTIQKDLGMGDQDYANIVNIFLVAYTAAYLVAGKLADRLGTRAGMGIFVLWWSVSNMLTAAAQGVRSLGAFRFSLGLGEAGVWPAASKAVSEWFPPRERALAIGFYTMGATIGATLAPYVVIPLALFPYAEKLPIVDQVLGHGAGWRMAFLITGGVGILWLIPWIWLYSKPRESQLITAEELKLIEEPEKNSATGGEDLRALNDDAGASWSWSRVLTFKATWLLLLGRLMTDAVWYFYQFWFAKYLNTDRGVAQDELTITWIVYAAAGVGSIVGGWLSGWFVKRGGIPAACRMRVMFGCACLMPLSMLIPKVTGLNMTMALTSVVVLASLAWLINISSIVVDVVPKHSVGTVFSVVAAGSTLGGIIMNTLVASMVGGPATKTPGFLDRGIHSVFGGLLDAVQGQGYGRWFLIMAFLHPLAWVILYFAGIHRPAGKTRMAAPGNLPSGK